MMMKNIPAPQKKIALICLTSLRRAKYKTQPGTIRQPNPWSRLFLNPKTTMYSCIPSAIAKPPKKSNLPGIANVLKISPFEYSGHILQKRPSRLKGNVGKKRGKGIIIQSRVQCSQFRVRRKPGRSKHGKDGNAEIGLKTGFAFRDPRNQKPRCWEVRKIKKDRRSGGFHYEL